MVCQARACSEHSELVIVGVRIPQVPIAAVLVKAIVLCSSLPVTTASHFYPAHL